MLSDTLGATTMKDIINNRKPPGATEYTILGPFHRTDAPELPLGSNMAGNISGEPVVVRGRVLAPDGRPIPNAVLDVWQSDAEGYYESADEAARLNVPAPFYTVDYDFVLEPA